MRKATILTPFMCKALDAWIDEHMNVTQGTPPSLIELTAIQFRCLVHEIVAISPLRSPNEVSEIPMYRGIPIKVRS
jgi:hypothetical protein